MNFGGVSVRNGFGLACFLAGAKSLWVGLRVEGSTPAIRRPASEKGDEWSTATAACMAIQAARGLRSWLRRCHPRCRLDGCPRVQPGGIEQSREYAPRITVGGHGDVLSEGHVTCDGGRVVIGPDPYG